MLGPARRLVPRAIRRRYAVKFALALLVIGLTVAAIGYVGTGAVASSAEDRVHADHEALTAHEARNVEQWNERNLFFVERTATGLAEAEDERTYLQSVKAEEDGIHDVHHVNFSEQRILQSTNDELHGESAASADEPWVIDPRVMDRFGDEIFADPIAGTAHDGTPVVIYGQFLGDGDRLVLVLMDMRQYTQEMISPESSVGYVVYTGSRAEMIFDDDQALGTPGPVVVMDEAERSFFAPYDQDEVDFDEVGLEPRRFRVERPGDALATSAGERYADEPFLATAVQVTEGSDWYVVTHTPESEAYGFVDTIRDYGLLASLSGLFAVVLVGGVIGHNTSRSIERLTARAERMERGDLDVEFDTDRVDSIGRLYDGFATMRDSLRQQIHQAQAARQEAEEARAETEQINERLRARADEYRAVLQRCAEGDLSARMNPHADNEAMADVASSFNAMMAEIERTVARLSEFADEVATASEQVTASSEEVRSASGQVTESVQAISEGAERQNESLRSATGEMESLSNTTEEIAASSNEVADLAEQTARTGREGRAMAQNAMGAFETLEEERAAVVAEFEALEAEVAQIDELTDRIAEVAEQTNLLALNANIEASRSADSDEEGGFGVVAEEIKELSDDARDAAEEIGERVDGIQAQTERSAEEVAATSQEIERVSEMVGDAVSALDEIADLAQETNDGVQEISAATEQQAASTEEVVAIVDEAATISEETTSEAQNVAAAAEEQTTALTEVSASAGDLSEQASRLSAALDGFETRADVDGGDIDELVEDGAERAEPVPPSNGAGAAGGDDSAGDEPAPSPDGGRSDDGDDPGDVFDFAGGE